MPDTPRLPCVLISFLCLMTLNATLQRAQAQNVFTGDFQFLSGVTLTDQTSLLPGLMRVSPGFESGFSNGRFYSSAAIRNRFEASVDSFEFALPELWVELFFDNSDLRVGRQFFRWGLSSGNAPFDVIRPLDLRNFLLEPEAALVRGSPALSYLYYAGNSTFHLIFSPRSNYSNIPEPDSRWFIPIPVPANIPLQFEADPDNQSFALQPQAGLLWNHKFPSLELQIGVLRWTPPIPSYRKEFQLFSPENAIVPPQLVLTEERIPTWIAGAGFSLNLSPFLTLVAEAAWSQARQFDRIPEFLINFDPLKSDLIGYARVVWLVSNEENYFLSKHSSGDFLIELRYIRGTVAYALIWSARSIFNPDEHVLQDPLFQSLTSVIRRGFVRDRLTAELITVWQVNGRDYWVRPQLAYDLFDNITVAGGVHYFGGPLPDTNYGQLSFGSYRGNRHSYFSLRYFW